MKYDRRIHLTTDQLSDLMGVPTMKMTNVLRNSEGAPRVMFRAKTNGKSQGIYDKAVAIAWLDTMEIEQKPERNVTPARTPAAFKPLTLSDGIRNNFARAAQLYPKGIRSQGGVVGNGVVYERGFGERV